MKNNFNKAFTLVELIVVITILAVLATIAFISFQGYSSESRDTKRMTDIATISKGLQVYLAKNSQVPEPSETKTTVSYSGSQLLTQGYAGDSVLNTIAVKDAKDPVDNQFYTYSTNANNTKFQVLALLEKNQTANLISNTTFADYSDRNIYSAGQSVGILVDHTNTPIQELGNTTIDLQSTSDSFQTILSQNNISSQTGSNLQKQILGAQENLFGWRAFDPNCPIEDIYIGDQVWAGCNSTLGNSTQWGIGYSGGAGTIGSCYNYDGVTDITDGKCLYSQKLSNISSPYDFFISQQPDNQNQHGDTEYQTIWGNIYTWGDAVDGACPSGWHLPTDGEWQELENYLGCSDSSVQDNWRCQGLGWKFHSSTNKNNNIANKLLIPLGGDMYIDSNTFYTRGGNTRLWTSSGDENGAYSRRFTWYNEGLYRAVDDVEHGFYARCIKD